MFNEHDKRPVVLSESEYRRNFDQQTIIPVLVDMSSSPGPEELPEKELFTSVCYIIASSLPGERADQLRHILDINGAVYLEKGLVDTTLNTIITNSNRFEGWEDAARRQNIRVVSDKWVERSVVLGKLQP